VPPPLSDGIPCVLVHDAGGNAATWARQIEALGAGAGAVALDFPGHGRSSGIAGPGDVAAHADVVERVIDWLGRAVALVGWGLGGAACLEVAGRGSARLGGLVLVGTAERFAVPEELVAILRDVVRGRRPQHFGTELFAPETPLDVMKAAWTEQVKTDPRVWLEDLERLAAWGGRDLAGRVSVPTLVLGGAHDRLAAPDQARALADGICGARVEIVDRAGHQLPIEQADTVSAALTGFVETLA